MSTRTRLPGHTALQRARSRSPVVPVYDPDAQPIPQCLAVSTVLAGTSLEHLLFVFPFVAQDKGEGKTC